MVISGSFHWPVPVDEMQRIRQVDERSMSLQEPNPLPARFNVGWIEPSEAEYGARFAEGVLSAPKGDLVPESPAEETVVSGQTMHGDPPYLFNQGPNPWVVGAVVGLAGLLVGLMLVRNFGRN